MRIAREFAPWLFAVIAVLFAGPAFGQPAKPLDPAVAEAASLATFQEKMRPFLAKHCISCHGPKLVEGELNLDTLEANMKTSTSAARWAVVLQKLVTREMPPEDKPRPADAEIAEATRWIQAEMKRSGKSVARRQESHNGNALDHGLLFDPQQAAPFDSPARVRRLSPELYAGIFNDLAKGRAIGQPFSPEGKSAFKDIGAPKVDEPITSQLLRNALAIVEHQTRFKTDNGKFEMVGFAPKEFGVLINESVELKDSDIEAAIKTQFDRALRRKPTAEELERYVAFMKKNIADAGRLVGARYTLAAVLLQPEAIFRMELGGGDKDAQGRVRLTPREIASSLAFALTDRRPEMWLLTEAEQGKLDTPEGVAAAVKKMLADPKLEKPRMLRFFREYFGYDRVLEVFKDNKENQDHDARTLVEDTDKLVLYVLEQDQQVLRELLTTNKSFVAWRTAADSKKKQAEALAKFEAEKAKNPEKFKTKMPPRVGRQIYLSYNLDNFPDQQPVELPAEQRAGILTQPAWLVAWSQSTDNHAILRGKWVRERLLGGVVPDVPITVDAQLPIAPEKTLRERMEVTRQEYCWKCHQLMNPVGLPFEAYDHFGRYRTEELAKPVVTTGAIDHVGDAALEGDVIDPIGFVKKMADSDRVTQVFLRHAFRYWMGRNETLGDAGALQAMEKAYRDSNGSMQALLVALLSSDSFLYRVPSAEKANGK